MGQVSGEPTPPFSRGERAAVKLQLGRDAFGQPLHHDRDRGYRERQ
jgi:hypothetical protein